MPLPTFRFTITQGATYRRKVTLYDKEGKPIKLQGASIFLDILPIGGGSRKHSCSLEDGHIIVSDPESGIFYVDMPVELTSTFNFDRAKCTVSIRFTDGAQKPILDGNIFVNRRG